MIPTSMDRSAVKRLKTLRHPSVLTFLAECDSPTSGLEAEIGQLTMSLLLTLFPFSLSVENLDVNICLQCYWRLSQYPHWANTLARFWTEVPRGNITWPGESSRWHSQNGDSCIITCATKILVVFNLGCCGFGCRFKNAVDNITCQDIVGLSSSGLPEQWCKAEAQQHQLCLCLCDKVPSTNRLTCLSLFVCAKEPHLTIQLHTGRGIGNWQGWNMFVPPMLNPRLRFFPALKSIMMLMWMIGRRMMMWMIARMMMMIKILSCLDMLNPWLRFIVCDSKAKSGMTPRREKTRQKQG